MVITNAFLDGVNSITATSVDIVHINKQNIERCIGCYNCWTKTPGKCIFKDDMPELMQSYINADLVIWSFPLYHYAMPSGIKAFLERLLPITYPDIEILSDGKITHPPRYDLSRQQHVLISTCGFPTIENNYEGLFKQFDILLDGDYKKIICAEGDLFKFPQLDKKTGEYLSYVKKAGVEYIKTGSFTADTENKLQELLYPKEQFAKLANAHWERSDTTDKSIPTGTKDASFNLLSQMSAIYNPKAYEKDIVLEFYFTDLDRRYQLVIQKDACTVLTDNFKAYTTRIETSFELWSDISAGKINGSQALVEKKYKVKGDFGAMLAMDELFGVSKPAGAAKDNIKTNMGLLLFPFIALWIAMPMDIFHGGVVGILVSALALALSVKYKTTIYDKLGMVAVMLLGIMGILSFDQTPIVSLSYLLFGTMWLASTFTKIPLTAHYSAYSYGGEEAFDNLLFMKTNKILTQSWGVVFIIFSITSYYLLNSALSSYTGIVNTVLSLMMAMFTIWFQKWYPARIARG
ncbi:MAG: NAD(P)H-dependent oxidoreductase [Firmicutes bacterium]|nr:NAD(P)H-dependent oxidoreductase [Bacillota bacterium]